MAATRRTGKRTRSRRPTMASKADPHELYQRSVQDPPADVDFLARVYRRIRGRVATSLREDFCGTALLSLEWARSRRDRRAVGVDLHQPTLDWGRVHHFADADPNVAARVELHCANVLDGVGPRCDITCALNFSYCVFKTRAEMRDYFRAARGRLASDGVFVLDVLGGTDAMIEDETKTKLDGFTYVWEQARFNPLTHDILCHIHFDFPDGSSMRRAFTYDWRLWTIPELRELLQEAGFSRVHVYWERTDRDGEGLGTFYEPESVENEDVWWTYVLAER